MRILVLQTLALAIAAVPGWSQIVQTPSPAQTPVYFPGIPAGASIPIVVGSSPVNGDLYVDPAKIAAIRIKWSEPMDVATFYWPLPTAGTQNFPLVTAQPYWENNNETVVLPVSLAIHQTYRIPINQGNQVFRSAKGVPANAGYISFRTDPRGSSVPASQGAAVHTPIGFRAAGGTPRPGVLPGALGSGSRQNTQPQVPATVVPTFLQHRNSSVVQPTPTPAGSSNGGMRFRTQKIGSKNSVLKRTPTPTPNK
jgi:hypothetical protein